MKKEVVKKAQRIKSSDIHHTDEWESRVIALLALARSLCLSVVLDWSTGRYIHEMDASIHQSRQMAKQTGTV